MREGAPLTFIQPGLPRSHTDTFCACTYRPSLPPTINPSVAVSSIRKQRGLLLNLIRHCLPSLANSLLAECIIPRDLCERACNQSLGNDEKGVALLDCIEARVEAVPSDFAKVVRILEAEPFLSSQAKELVKSYCTISSAPIDHPQVPSSLAISNYRAYLKIVYNRSAISPHAKWPPTPCREYISLAVVEGGGRCRDDYIGYTLQGNLEQVFINRKEISVEEILEGQSASAGLVLIEGPPGIGKSTLVWELCRKWEEFSCMKLYDLVVLLRLREEEVQEITSVSQLFYSYESKDKDALTEEVSEGQGRGVLFILDGFDELPKALQRKSFLLNLIKGNILPASAVLVTSRPSATAELLASCDPRKHVEILGFTQESIEAYASSVFQSEPARFEKFKNYISISNNPAINSLMYVPLNAAIIVQIYQNNSNDSSILPHTLTELYIELCLTVLNRFLRNKGINTVNKVEDLSELLYQQFLRLSELAFKGMKNEEVIFHSVFPDLIHFGFLDAVSALYGGGRVSYNFLHLTIQEFLAAYHISQLHGNGLEVFLRYRGDERWNVVWRFVAGLTKFKHFQGHIMDHDLFVTESSGHEVWVSLLFLWCLFEAQTIDYFLSTPAPRLCCISLALGMQTSLEQHALGYCIANIPTRMAWKVKIDCFESHFDNMKRFTTPLAMIKKPSNVIQLY